MMSALKKDLDDQRMQVERLKYTFKFRPTENLKAQPPDAVNHPAHYGGDTVYEAIKVIDAWKLGFELGNVLKYIKRSGSDKGALFLKRFERIEDLKKAKWYLQHFIEQLEKVCEPKLQPWETGPISDTCGKLPPDGWVSSEPANFTIANG